MKSTSKELHTRFLLALGYLCWGKYYQQNHLNPPQPNLRDMNTRHPQKMARFSHFESEAANLNEMHE